MATAKMIWDFMRPLLLQSTSHQELENLLIKLCMDAFSLAIDLRRSKHIYKFEEPASGQVVDQDEVEPQASEKDLEQGLGVPRIAFSLSSALVKYPAHSLGERVVLEKAHVVILD
jgi:hypothetical protein